ncbi:head-tail connector protein [Nocardiopsis lucentensis]|uniref:hypothetical protein n=1 Tax=Nocardiopsis lucentensis TaxID=53441 RepID=UPI0003464F64|nr:hypothetical protein [Nocardiopsis lucentensis]
MPLSPLATRADMTALGVAIDASEEQLVDRYLGVASAAVRSAAGCPISQTTGTVVLAGRCESRLPMPGPPVTSVTTVLIDEAQVDDWRLSRPRASLFRSCGWGGVEAEVEVTYTHGLATVPADIVDLVCRIATQSLVAYRSGSGGEGLAAGDVRSERIGDYSVTYGGDGLITEMELPDYLRTRLRSRFGGGAAVLRSL